MVIYSEVSKATALWCFNCKRKRKKDQKISSSDDIMQDQISCSPLHTQCECLQRQQVECRNTTH